MAKHQTFKIHNTKYMDTGGGEWGAFFIGHYLGVCRLYKGLG